MTPERLELIKDKYLHKGYSYEEGPLYHMFTSPDGTWSEDHHKITGHTVCMNPKKIVNLVSTKKEGCK